MTIPPEPTDPFDEEGLRRAIERHWTHHSPCNVISVEVNYRPDRADWNILIAPAFQEVVGGSQDGILVWSGFDFDIANFLEEPELEVNVVGMASYLIEKNPTPFVGFKGRFKGKPFFLRISLEPIPDSKVLELVDAIRNQVRPVEKEWKQ
jgi:hypothetical protein